MSKLERGFPDGLSAHIDIQANCDGASPAQALPQVPWGQDGQTEKAKQCTEGVLGGRNATCSG